jgi:hypothetical protein
LWIFAPNARTTPLGLDVRNLVYGIDVCYQPVAPVDFLRLMPQKIPGYRAARTSGTNAVCRVKNRLKADFLGSYARSATNCYVKLFDNE